MLVDCGLHRYRQLHLGPEQDIKLKKKKMLKNYFNCQQQIWLFTTISYSCAIIWYSARFYSTMCFLPERRDRTQPTDNIWHIFAHLDQPFCLFLDGAHRWRSASKRHLGLCRLNGSSSRCWGRSLEYHGCGHSRWGLRRIVAMSPRWTRRSWGWLKTCSWAGKSWHRFWPSWTWGRFSGSKMTPTFWSTKIRTVLFFKNVSVFFLCNWQQQRLSCQTKIIMRLFLLLLQNTWLIKIGTVYQDATETFLFARTRTTFTTACKKFSTWYLGKVDWTELDLWAVGWWWMIFNR